MASFFALALKFPASALAQSSGAVTPLWALITLRNARPPLRLPTPKSTSRSSARRSRSSSPFWILSRISAKPAPTSSSSATRWCRDVQGAGWLEPLDISDGSPRKARPGVAGSLRLFGALHDPACHRAVQTRYFSDGNAPTSWADLLDDRFKGRIATGDPKTTGMVHVPMWFIIEHLGGKVGEPFGWS